MRLAQTSRRSRRAIAADLGAGLATLRNRIDGRREREMDHPPADRPEDIGRLHKELALAALRRALVVRQPEPGLLHPSESGSQPCANVYQAEPRGHGIVISMSGTGNCFADAVVETFFKTLTSELVWRPAFQTRAAAIAALARYIDGFHNPRRRHSALGFTSPAQFERGSAHQTALH